MLILSGLPDWASGVLELLIMLVIWINALIYDLAAFLFEIFYTVAEARIFTSADYTRIANSVYLVIGVVALFIISYALLRAIIDPDAASKGNYSAGKIIPNIIISVGLIAFVPVIFNNAYKAQSAVISSGVIPNIIFGGDVSGNTVNEDGTFSIKKTGRQMANDVFIGFFVPIDQSVNSTNLTSFYQSIEVSHCWLAACEEDVFTFYDAKEAVVNRNKSFTLYGEFAGSMHGKSDEHKIDYNFFLQFVCGCFLVYVIANFCIDMAVRSVKLGYFQIIAPIPILTIMLPGQKKIFDNWLKNTISTFLDIFIRIAVIYLGVLLINKLPNLGDAWTQSATDANLRFNFWARALLIVGILIFMKQAPKLISDIFGLPSGSFKLGIKDKLGEMAFVGDKTKELLSSAQGAATGALGAGWTSHKNGMGWKTGMKYGFSQGWKSGKSNPNQFSSMRQTFYSDAMQGEGKAAFFRSGRSYFDKTGADWKKDAKNAYIQENFNRVLKHQQSDEWRNLYEHSYDMATNELKTKKSEKQNEISRITEAHDKVINDLKREIANGEGLQTRYNNLTQQYEEKKSVFENSKKERLETLKTQYESAVNRGDLTGQAYYKSQIDNINSEQFVDADLENKIKNIRNTMPDLKELRSSLASAEAAKASDTDLKELGDEIKGLDDNLKSLGEEHDYLIDKATGAVRNRTYADEKKFITEHGSFTKLYDTVNSRFKEGISIDEDGNEVIGKANSDFKDVFDTHKKNLLKVQTDAYLDSAEGQRQVAIREKAEKLISDRASGGSKDAKK